MVLDKASILSVAKPRIITVSVPEWGGEVCMRELTAGQRDQWDAWTLEHEGSSRYADIRARMLVMVLCDEAGTLLFADSDIPLVSSLPAGAIDRLWDRATKLANMRAEDVEKN